MTSNPLHRLAAAHGLQDRYWDVAGQEQFATDEALLAVLGVVVGRPSAASTEVLAAAEDEMAAAADRVVEPTVVWWTGDVPAVELRLPASVERVIVTLRLEVDRSLPPGPMTARPHELSREIVLATDALTLHRRGQRRTWRLDLSPTLDVGGWAEGPPIGRHELTVELVGTARTTSSVVLCAPRRVASLDPGARLWGVFAPAYSLWTRARPEPHLGHLARLSEWLDAQGGKVLATLPLLATFYEQPCEPSPYTPVSRRWWNELYLDFESRPELAECEPARTLLAAASSAPNPSMPFDAVARYWTVRAVIGELAAHVANSDGPWGQDLRAFATSHPDALDYARFRAMVEQTGRGWRSWGGGARADVAALSVDDPAVRAHLYAQWAMQRQLARLADGLDRRGQRLYLDLPVGTHGEGFDTWSEPDLWAWGASAGAPPDAFFADGQTWGFPPMRPASSRLHGHAHLAACLRAHMRVAGMLRLDHVMGLQRLFFVPDGGGPADGVYVRYPADEQFATVAIESHRSGCVVVGEDLGTVPDEVRSAMAEHGLLGMHVSEFEVGSWPGAELGAPGPGVVAALDTHDTPTFPGWLAGEDIDRRWAAGSLDVVGADHARDERATQIDNVLASLRRRGLLPADELAPATSPDDRQKVLRAALRLLGDTDAEVVLASLDDLLGSTEPQNVPGTPPDRPNWVRRVDRPVADLVDDEQLRTTLRALQDARLGSWSRTQG